MLQKVPRPCGDGDAKLDGRMPRRASEEFVSQQQFAELKTVVERLSGDVERLSADIVIASYRDLDSRVTTLERRRRPH